MFPNLEAEMARNKVTQVKLAEILGITPTTLSFKMNGKSTLSLTVLMSMCMLHAQKAMYVRFAKDWTISISR